MKLYRRSQCLSALLLLWVLSSVSSSHSLAANIPEDWQTQPGSMPCGGYFKSPELGPKGPERQISLSADRAYFVPDGTSHAQGHARLQWEDQLLEADELSLSRDPHSHAITKITAQGRVSLYQPGMRLMGSHAYLEPIRQQQFIEHASFRLYERRAWGQARHIIAQQDRIIRLKDAEFTTCSPLDPVWRLKVRKLKLDRKKGRGQGQGARLYYAGIPILASPWLDFPLDDRRQSGLLIPALRYSSHSGTYLSLPFYWNMAPNYDLVFRPAWLSRRGTQINSHYRYLTRNSQGYLKASFLAHDQAFSSFVQQALKDTSLPPRDPRRRNLSVKHRYALQAQHHSELSASWLFDLDFAQVSDDNYFVDFGNSINTSNTIQLRQAAILSQNHPRYTFSVSLQKHQILNPFFGSLTDPVYSQLPQLMWNLKPQHLPGGLILSGPLEFSYFHQRDIGALPVPQGQRLHWTPALSLPWVSGAAYLKPRVQMDIANYHLKTGQAGSVSQPKHLHRVVPILDLDAGLNFERRFQVRQTSLKQTLEPRLYYLYVPYANQQDIPIFDTSFIVFDYNQLYRSNRFLGGDRINDAHQITLGLSTRLIEDEQGLEKLKLDLGQIIYFKDRKVSLCDPRIQPNCIAIEDPFAGHHKSNWAMRLQHQYDARWMSVSNLEWDPFKHRLEKFGLDAQYHHQQQVFNIGYQYIRHPSQNQAPYRKFPLKQWYASTAWHLDAKWRLLARVHYDQIQKLPQQISLGLEHQGCCTALRLLGSRYLEPRDPLRLGRKDYNNGVMLQFVFKGFASVGHSNLNETITQMIEGYRK